MAGNGRNAPCVCGSGRKSKHCCGSGRGPSEQALARAYLGSEALRSALVLEGVSRMEFRGLFERVEMLPAFDLSLVLPLPAIVAPELGRLLAAVAEDDLDAIEEALPAAVERVDNVEARAALGRAVLALRDQGRIDERVAAVALIDLDSSGDGLLAASLVQAAAIATGAARTPGGIVVAAAA